MANATNPTSDATHTSDGEPRSNLMTRDEFMRQVLYSGQLTKIAQHIALVVFLVAEGRNQLKLSLRDLERITGWDHKAIKDHMSELEVFMRVTFGGGRAKALWELQGVVEDALAKAVVVGSRTPQAVVGRDVPTTVIGVQHPATDVIGADVPTSVVPAHVPTSRFMYPHVPTSGFVAAHVATSLMAAVVPTTGVVAADVPTRPAIETAIGVQNPTSDVVGSSRPTNSPSIERERVYNSNSIPNFSLSATPRASEHAHEAGQVQLNGVAIYGPGFTIEYAAIDLAAGMIGMPKERARAIAEICARDWASNNKKPDSPMAMIKKAIKSDFNDGQIQSLRMETAATKSATTKESRAARLLRHVEQAAEKGGRS